jgi:hypothetical protein
VNRGKTENAVRPIPLADWCVTMLVTRRTTAENLDGPIFPSSTGTIREATNVRNRAWKPFTVRAGYEWVTFRTCITGIVTDLTPVTLAGQPEFDAPSTRQAVS